MSRALDPTKRPTLAPRRMRFAIEELTPLGCRVEGGPDRWSLRVMFPNGRRFHFWPYTGYFNGAATGRGIRNLIKAGAA